MSLHNDCGKASAGIAKGSQPHKLRKCRHLLLDHGVQRIQVGIVDRNHSGNLADSYVDPMLNGAGERPDDAYCNRQ